MALHLRGNHAITLGRLLPPVEGYRQFATSVTVRAAGRGWRVLGLDDETVRLCESLADAGRIIMGVDEGVIAQGKESVDRQLRSVRSHCIEVP